LNQQLYWTTTGGQEWQDITPPQRGQAVIQAVDFVDTVNGWLILSSPSDTGQPVYLIAQTSDGGVNWQTKPLQLFQSGEPAAIASIVYLRRLNDQVGWLVIKQATSSNFNQGSLFKTNDGGQTWQRLTLPLGEPVAFVTPEVGWIIGGLDSTHIYHTNDSGQNWQLKNDQYLPTSGALQMGRYPNGLVVLEPGSNHIWYTTNGEQFSEIVLNSSTDSGLKQVSLVTPTTAWASFSFNNCTPSYTSKKCQSVLELKRTTDGGQNWIMMRLPGQIGDSIRTEFTVEEKSELAIAGDDLSLQALGNQTATITGQGFDKCEVPTLSQLQNWITNSPYRSVNLYIGGSARSCANSALNASFITQAKQQGWSFIPTWVGPQASCSGYSSRMSSDANTAYNQGVNEANAAIAVASNLGLTLADQSGTIIYYDLENYDTTNSGCRNAAKSFISGWTNQLQARANKAGVYGSSCGSAINDFATLGSNPDAVWPANWLLPAQYRSNATVWGVACLIDDHWYDHQRIRQYAGGHNETWGGIALTIDSNVIDGPVATLSSSPDLQISNETIETTGYFAGSRIGVQAKITNNGNSNAAQNTIGYYVSGSNNGNAIDGGAIGKNTVPVLSPGASSDFFYQDINIPLSVTPGTTYYTVFEADIDKVVTEGNESNNKKSLSFTVQPCDPSTMYCDVPSSRTFRQEIEALRDKISNGCNSSANTIYKNAVFCPDMLLDRAAMSVFAVKRKLGWSPTLGSYKGYFADVPQTHPFALWIEKAKDLGIVNGCGTNPQGQALFCPDYNTSGKKGLVTRANIAIYLANTEQWDLSHPTQRVFSDVTGDNLWERAVEYMYWQGWISGASSASSCKNDTPSGNPPYYCPGDYINRGTGAGFMARVFGYVNVQPRCASLTVSINPLNSGTVTQTPPPDCPISGSKYKSETNIVLTANPTGSYSFGDWSGGAVGSTNPLTLQVGPQNKAVTANFIASPVLQVNPTSLNFNGIVGSDPAAQSFTISNGATGSLNWTASSNASWLNLSSTSGTTPATVNALVNTGGLAAGTHSAQITISSSGAQGSPQTIEVTLTIPTQTPTSTPTRTPTPTATYTPTPNSPSLNIPANVSASVGQPVQVPVQFISNGAAISAVTFSIDYDHTCLTFDSADSDGDGIPNGVSFNLPTAFAGGVVFNSADTAGELDFTIGDYAPPLASLSSQTLATITFVPKSACQPATGVTRTIAVNFASQPTASFGSSAGGSISGSTTNGSVSLSAIRSGDTNGDGKVDAGDISALVLEIFDNDGNLPGNVSGGSFPGFPGADANSDGKVDAGDITCTVLRIFGGSCGGAAALNAQPLAGPSLTLPNRVTVNPGGKVTVPVQYTSNGNSISSIIFSVDLDPAWLTFASTDANTDGLPDAVQLSLPTGFNASVTYDPTDTDGELDISIFDPSLPLATLPEGQLMTLTFTAGTPPSTTETALNLSVNPPLSFGNTGGISVTGNGTAGSVLIQLAQKKVYLPIIINN
jgi:photosystem II stability/assembly factor-like uncharacterized protein